MSSERLIVEEGIYDRFVERVVALTKDLRQGPPRAGIIDVGAMVSPLQVQVVEDLVSDAVQKGAKVLAGGALWAIAGSTSRQRCWSMSRPRCASCRKKIAGPLMVISRVKNDEEAIALANATDYGLNASIYAGDRKRAKRIEERIEAGGTCINGFGLTYMAQALPFGGVKASGFGRLNGREGLRACTVQKSVLEDRFPIHVPTPLRRGEGQRL